MTFDPIFVQYFYTNIINIYILAMPMGQMPVLEVDGKRVHQSISMARFLAKTVGLAGINAWEDLQIDIVVDTINDFRLSTEQC